MPRRAPAHALAASSSAMASATTLRQRYRRAAQIRLALHDAPVMARIARTSPTWKRSAMPRRPAAESEPREVQGRLVAQATP